MPRWYVRLVGFGGMLVLGIISSTVRLLSFGLLVNFNRLLVFPAFCRFLLFMVGVRVKYENEQDDETLVYMFNHNSFLDIFIIPILGLNNITSIF